MQNLGVALGAYAQEANRQRELARQDEMLAMQKEQFGWQRDEQQEKKDYRSRVGELQREYGTFKQLYADPLKNRAQLQPILSKHGVTIGDDGNYYDASGKAYAPAQFGPIGDSAYINHLRAIGRPEDFAQGLTAERDWNYKLGRDTTVDAREDRKLGQTDRQLDITDNRYKQMLDLERQKLALERELAYARIGAMRATGGGGDGGSAKPQMREVTWMGQDGKPRTGLVGFAQDGGRLRAFDPATGQELPTQDPRFQAVLNGAPKNTRPELSIQDRKLINDQAMLNLEQIVQSPGGKRLPLAEAQRLATETAFKQFGLPSPFGEEAPLADPYAGQKQQVPQPPAQPQRPAFGLRFDQIAPPPNSRIPR